MDFKESGFMYALGGFIVVFVLAQSLFFLIRAWKQGKKLGLSTAIMRGTVTQSALFSLAPAISIVATILTLYGALGIVLPWIRLTVIGAISYEVPAAESAMEALGYTGGLSAEITDPLLGDMTTLPARILSGEVEAPDLFCGGTPCQAFSVAGLRRSLDAYRGNLSLVFCEIANAIDTVRTRLRKRPVTIFWENVPGVLNTKDNAFGCLLAGLSGADAPLSPGSDRWPCAGVVTGLARNVAWRVLDAQYFGVPQRRRRVYVVASSAARGIDPAKVLF